MSLDMCKTLLPISTHFYDKSAAQGEENEKKTYNTFISFLN